MGYTHYMQRILVCIHGWGGSKASFDPLRTALHDSGILVLTPDLPGFGGTQDPPVPWSVDDYANWVIDWITTQLQELHIDTNEIEYLGHSHGGRIGIKLAHWQSSGQALPFYINHLYLCAAAGIRHPRHIKRIIGISLAKSGKFLTKLPGLRALAPLGKKLLYKLVRVHDYEQASPVLQRTLQLVSKQDLTPLLATITLPTDLFWGTADGMTPYSDALVMNKRITGSVLHTYQNIRHGVHKECAKEIAEVVHNKI